jgi:hypothetical protein
MLTCSAHSPRNRAEFSAADPLAMSKLPSNPHCGVQQHEVFPLASGFKSRLFCTTHTDKSHTHERISVPRLSLPGPMGTQPQMVEAQLGMQRSMPTLSTPTVNYQKHISQHSLQKHISQHSIHMHHFDASIPNKRHRHTQPKTGHTTSSLRPAKARVSTSYPSLAPTPSIHLHHYRFRQKCQSGNKSETNSHSLSDVRIEALRTTRSHKWTHQHSTTQSEAYS